jgi:hypothetical protein
MLANYFRLYGSSAYGFQAYLSLVDNVQFRKCLSRFRCSNHCLEIETGRRTNDALPSPGVNPLEGSPM